MNILFSVHWILIASIWYFGNGLLHDISVLANHKGGYNRELLRLLTTGHILIFSGIVLFVCYLMMLNKIQCGAVIAIILATSMIIYCLMIFPFLKSFGTMAISVWVIVVCMRLYSSFPNIYEIMQNYK
jgi:hypothetical protein